MIIKVIKVINHLKVNSHLEALWKCVSDSPLVVWIGACGGLHSHKSATQQTTTFSTLHTIDVTEINIQYSLFTGSELVPSHIMKYGSQTLYKSCTR